MTYTAPYTLTLGGKTYTHQFDLHEEQQPTRKCTYMQTYTTYTQQDLHARGGLYKTPACVPDPRFKINKEGLEVIVEMPEMAEIEYEPSNGDDVTDHEIPDSTTAHRIICSGIMHVVENSQTTHPACDNA